MQKQDQYLRELERQLREHISKHPLWSLCLEGNLKSHLESLVQLFLKDVRENYCEKLKAYYESHGDERWSEKPRIDDHTKWTVKIRVKCSTPDEVSEAFKEIAREKRRNENAIKKAVRENLTILGLPLEPSFHPAKGRPVGKKDSPKSRRQQYWLA